MKIAYDISVLGASNTDPRARTGIFRYVENVANGLAEADNLEVGFCALNYHHLAESKKYWEAHPELFQNSFIKPDSLSIKVSELIIRCLDQLGDWPNTADKPFFKKQIGSKIARILLSNSYKIFLLSAKQKIENPKAISTYDIYHSPFYPIPTKLKKKLKRTKLFLTVCDLIPIKFPHFFKFNEQDIVEKAISSISPNDWTICISQSTRDDLCNFRKELNPDRVFVTHLAASNIFYQCTDKLLSEKVKSKYGIPSQSRYFLGLSTLEPRKNIAHTIKCFAKFIIQEKVNDLFLVLAGPKGWDYEHLFDEIAQISSDSLKKRIIITGFIPDEDMAPLYSGALAFIYPSIYEGFGLPPLEAMQCGTPVITSNTSSMPEVVGDAAISLDPMDMDGLCQSMCEIFNDSEIYKEMSSKSLARAKQFSWSKCLEKTIEAYKTALDS